MNLSNRLTNSFYQVVAAINEPHNVYLVQHRDSGRFYVRKTLDVYSADVYKDLQAHPIPALLPFLFFKTAMNRHPGAIQQLRRHAGMVTDSLLPEPASIWIRMIS